MKFYLFAGWLLFLLLSGCAPYLHQPIQERPARIGERTRIAPMLDELPQPQSPVFVALYKFRDQTGQYRPSEVGASWSTAVTQGATSIMLRILEETPWFVPIERENVSNLIQERKIIRSTREQFGDKTPLPPLLFAGIILEGGIISYDANIMTGGVGARYFGAGGSTEYRQDRVTVELRAISTSNGRITKTVHASKTIYSQGVSGGLFRFVSFRRLLEAETGFTYNEPSELAVTEALEMAVYQLIVEGIRDNLWAVDSSQLGLKNELLANYADMERQSREVDVRGRIKQMGSGSQFAVGAQVSGQFYRGDYGRGPLRPGVGLHLLWSPSPTMFIEGRGNYFRLSAADDRYWGNFANLELNFGLRLLPGDRTRPYIYGGFGLLYQQDGISEFANEEINTMAPKFQTGLGIEQLISNRLSLSADLGFSYFTADKVDALKMGNYNDQLVHGQLALRYYLKH
ncbi:MAG: CsgG/HfaB family protein [Bacteroidota bacterium]